jgi:hypothetical protein
LLCLVTIFIKGLCSFSSFIFHKTFVRPPPSPPREKENIVVKGEGRGEPGLQIVKI